MALLRRIVKRFRQASHFDAFNRVGLAAEKLRHRAGIRLNATVAIDGQRTFFERFPVWLSRRCRFGSQDVCSPPLPHGVAGDVGRTGAENDEPASPVNSRAACSIDVDTS